MPWVIGLDSWIIQDGNYPDFKRGQEAEFAVEFYAPRGISRTNQPKVSARLSESETYETVARVVYTTGPETHAPRGVSVLDLGIHVYREEPLPWAQVDTFVALDLELGVDPFMYFERLHMVEGIPPLVYTWTINRIERQLAPFVEVRPHYFERDQSRWAWTEVQETDAWNDDDGHGSYRLHADRVDLPPRTRSRTAIQ
jgi:hypothetical protein